MLNGSIRGFAGTFHGMEPAAALSYNIAVSAFCRI
jgi:hypothetical protein